MCMYVIDPNFRQDQKDITVYKLVLRDSTDKFTIKYITPFTFTEIEMPYLKAKGKTTLRKIRDFFDNTIFYIEKGVIHSYTTIEKAYTPFKALQTKWKVSEIIKVELWKCIIPANVKYIAGINREIGSKSIKFIEDITDEVNRVITA